MTDLKPSNINLFFFKHSASTHNVNQSTTNRTIEWAKHANSHSFYCDTSHASYNTMQSVKYYKCL